MGSIFDQNNAVHPELVKIPLLVSLEWHYAVNYWGRSAM